MPKTNRPNSDVDVLTVMQKYCQDKGYTFSNAQLDYFAQSCFLYFESKGWKGITYWPAVCMRWVLNNLDKQYKGTYKPKLKHKGKSVRNKIMEREAEQDNNVI